MIKEKIKVVRIQDVFFDIVEHTNEDGVIGYDIRILPKHSSSYSLELVLPFCFETMEDGERFLEDLNLLKTKYNLPSF